MFNWYLIFTLISLIYVGKAFQTAYTLWRQWATFWDDDITPQDRQLAREVGFFFLIPISIFFHEVGHALATWMVGGRVAAFRWYIYWGYVQPVGYFTPAQDWWIALSGNVVSLLFGLGLLAWGYWGRLRPRILHELFLETGYFLAMYTLVGYPLLSLLGLVGDWVVIYDFRRTPLLSAATGLVHLALTVGLWRWWNHPAVVHRRLLLVQGTGEEMPAAPEGEEGEGLERTLHAARNYLQMGHPPSAIHLLEGARERVGDDPRVLALLGESWLHQQRPGKAIPLLRQALASGALSPEETQATRDLLALAFLLDDRVREAIALFEQADPHIPRPVLFLYWEGVAYLKGGERMQALARFRAFLERAAGEPALAEWVQYARAFVEELAGEEDV